MMITVTKSLTLALAVIMAAVLAQSQTQPQETNDKAPIAARDFSSPNVSLVQIFNQANEKLIARDNDAAIRLYDQGINLEPGRPELWVNKAAALMGRASVNRNKARYSQDEDVKRDLMSAARRDFHEASAAANKAATLFALIPAPSDPALASAYESEKLTIARLRAQTLWGLFTYVDQSYASNALAAIDDYITVETDPEEKLLAEIRAGQMMLMTGRCDEALAEYQKILLTDPDNIEGLVGMAASLIDLGELTNDATKIDQGIEYLKKFVQKAPDKHRLKGSAEDALNYLIQAKSIPTSQGVSKGTVESSSPAGVPNDDGSSPVQAGVLNGKALNLPKPPYPWIAQYAFARGAVVVHVMIDEEGNVISARAVSGHPLLQAVSVAAAREAKFTPTILSGQPVKVNGTIRYEFVAP
jgi:TonB family protein